jgi:hypothetical protein
MSARIVRPRRVGAPVVSLSDHVARVRATPLRDDRALLQPEDVTFPE